MTSPLEPLTPKPSRLETDKRDRWIAQLAVLRREVAAMPRGARRDEIEQRADRLDAAIKSEGWLRSHDLKPPE